MKWCRIFHWSALFSYWYESSNHSLSIVCEIQIHEHYIIMEMYIFCVNIMKVIQLLIVLNVSCYACKCFQIEDR